MRECLRTKNPEKSTPNVRIFRYLVPILCQLFSDLYRSVGIHKVGYSSLVIIEDLRAYFGTWDSSRLADGRREPSRR